MIPVLSMPSDDITHPIPDLTGYITEGQLVLTRALNNLGVYPPIDVPPSLSRLMKDGIGKDHTREDHARVAAQTYASYARALEVRNLASIIGAEDLSETDQNYLTFADAFERRFVGTARGRGTQRRRNPGPRLGPAVAVAAGGADPRRRGGPGQIPSLARRVGGGKMKSLPQGSSDQKHAAFAPPPSGGFAGRARPSGAQARTPDPLGSPAPA